MGLFLVTFVIMVLAVLAMAVGVMLGRNPIKGSCGGLSTIEGIGCICSTPCEKKRRAAELAAAGEQPLKRRS
jgi:hypothetical protein